MQALSFACEFPTPDQWWSCRPNSAVTREKQWINEQHLEWSKDRRRLRFVMDACRVQQTRRRKGLADFPCKPVGTVEFSTFARTVDPRIRTTCLACPPDETGERACSWGFSLEA